LNARKQLSDFIKKAKRQLLIYDPEVGDPAIINVLEERVKDGVEVRILGRLSRKGTGLDVKKLFMRLHTRTIIRDGEYAFLGSQSLRTAELDERREVGLMIDDQKLIARLMETFESDWAESQKVRPKESETQAADAPPQADKVAKKVAKALLRDMPAVAPVLEVVVREMAGGRTEIDLNAAELEAVEMAAPDVE
jgi:phosphatidylserine/phosphatidylglycerophosphate/cardiolipin synthase-like enzyme